MEMKVNDWIQAFDFEPIPNRPDAYVAGIITEVKENTYVINVVKDTMFPEGSRTIVEAPKQDKMIWDFKDRIREWPVQDACGTVVNDPNDIMTTGYNDEI
jgi:hypothetical protein